MTVDELVLEGDRLARPSLLLTEENNAGGIVAYWGGTGRKDLPAVHSYARRANKHWITLDCQWHSAHGSRAKGCISVYEGEYFVGSNRLFVVYDHNSALDSVKVDGVPLYGIEVPSFPPSQAVCLYGSQAVEDWLHSEGRTRYDYDAVRNSEIGGDYEQEWLKRTPWLNEEYAGVFGGWHVQWPEDHFYMPPEMKLMVWTFRDSETWLEVWERLPNFVVEARIS